MSNANRIPRGDTHVDLVNPYEGSLLLATEDVIRRVHDPEDLSTTRVSFIRRHEIQVADSVGAFY
jgi:hypothetical protein